MQPNVTEHKRDTNGYPYSETLIGRVVTSEPRVHRISYETASWFTLVEVPAGEYDIVKLVKGSLTWIIVRYHGIIVDEHFVNRVFGSSSIAPKRDIGKPRACSAQIYPYIADANFAEGRDHHGATWERF